MLEVVFNKYLLNKFSNGQPFVVAWPGPHITKAFYSNSDCIFFCDDGWLILNENGIRIPVSIPKPSNQFNNFDPAKVRVQLYKWLPVIYRWTPLDEEVEQKLSKAILQIYWLVNEIKTLEIDFVMYHTGVPHHYDSMILSIACEFAGVAQLFLQSNVFDGGLIPVIQKGGFTDRKICKWRRGKKNYSLELQAFINARVKGETPSTSDPQTKKANWWKESIFIAIVYLILLKLKLAILIVKLKITRKKISPFQLKDYSFISHLFFLFSQFTYLRLYEKNKLEKIPTYKLSIDEKLPIKLLIAAHYQPEATSFPEGWHYFDHIDMAIKLRSLGYEDEIFYKEHYGTKLFIERFVGLSRVGLCRSSNYFNRLQDLNCVFLSSDHPIPLKDEEYQNIIPVTITGTIAIERSLLGLRTIIFGNPWYKGLPGTIHIDDISTLNNIPWNWTVPCQKISQEAISFLESRLNLNTITNAVGIGIGKANLDSISQELFISECIDLVSNFRKFSCFD